MSQTIGIPTTYNGVRYRSRLEARWAVFFDSVGWKHVYEPEDFGGWIPDFALIHQDGPTYIEVKPVYAHDQETAQTHIDELLSIDIPEEREILLLGCDPATEPENVGPWAAARLGWFARDRHFGRSEAIIFATDTEGVDFASSDGNWRGRISGKVNKYFGSGDWFQTEIFEKAWKDAGNVVQWNAR